MDKYMNALKQIMAQRYAKDTYSIGQYQESSVCIQYIDNKWIVYNGERGNRYNEVQCDTPLQGCLEFFRRFTHVVNTLVDMENELLTYLTNAA